MVGEGCICANPATCGCEGWQTNPKGMNFTDYLRYRDIKNDNLKYMSFRLAIAKGMRKKIKKIKKMQT